MKSVYRAVGPLCLVVCALPAAAESLTTDSIISLARTGISDEAIVAKIKAEGQRFSVCVDDIGTLASNVATLGGYDQIFPWLTQARSAQ